MARIKGLLVLTGLVLVAIVALFGVLITLWGSVERRQTVKVVLYPDPKDDAKYHLSTLGLPPRQKAAPLDWALSQALGHAVEAWGNGAGFSASQSARILINSRPIHLSIDSVVVNGGDIVEWRAAPD